MKTRKLRTGMPRVDHPALDCASMLHTQRLILAVECQRLTAQDTQSVAEQIEQDVLTR